MYIDDCPLKQYQHRRITRQMREASWRREYEELHKEDLEKEKREFFKKLDRERNLIDIFRVRNGFYYE